MFKHLLLEEIVTQTDLQCLNSVRQLFFIFIALYYYLILLFNIHITSFIHLLEFVKIIIIIIIILRRNYYM
jgi:hypothetical protein